MDFLKEKLINIADAKGICAEGHKTLLECADKDALVDYYVQNPDWCLECDFPTLQMLRDHFSDAGKMGVYVDHTFHGEVLNNLQTYIFHNCKGTIKVGLNVEKQLTPMLYLANGCRLRIVGDGDTEFVKCRTQIPIYTFGKNDLSARDNKFVTFKVYNHSMIKNDM